MDWLYVLHGSVHVYVQYTCMQMQLAIVSAYNLTVFGYNWLNDYVYDQLRPSVTSFILLANWDSSYVLRSTCYNYMLASLLYVH